MIFWKVIVSSTLCLGYSSACSRASEDISADATVKEENGKWILTLTIPSDVDNFFCEPVTTENLGTPRITEERYENPDGTPIDFTKDFLGQTRTGAVRPGPFASLSSGTHQIVVWEK